jgi:signal peptide peptidase SppA
VEDLTPDLGSSIWAIRREALTRVMREARRAMLAHSMPQANRPRAARPSSVRAGGSVAVIPLCGIITPRGSWISRLFGGGEGGLQGFRASFREAMGSPDVGAIVIDVDSPGGVIDLVPETAAEIRDARGTKPIIAVANCTAASAAYWIASQADELVCTPSGDVGSIGVYMLHEDWSKFNEEIGVDPTFVSAGRYKTDGNPEEPLSESALADWQNAVDTLYAMFVNEVAAGRGVSADDVTANYGEGRMFFADAALEAGLVDRVDTLEAVIGGLLTPGATGPSAAQTGRAALASVPTSQAGEDDEEEQPRCPNCGRFLGTGQTECPDCDPDQDEDDGDDEEEDDDAEPEAMSREQRRAAADVLLG